jgi:hypothetical protein
MNEAFGHSRNDFPGTEASRWESIRQKRLQVAVLFSKIAEQTGPLVKGFLLLSVVLVFKY